MFDHDPIARDERLSQHFRIGEFLRSQTATRHGIDMTPPPAVAANLRRLVREVLQPLRIQVGRLTVTSGYRPPALNTLIGGSDHSAHLDGRAADIVSPDQWPINIARRAVQLMQRDALPIDQVILEFGQWVHIGIAREGERPRGEVLTSEIHGDDVVYRTGLVSLT